MPSIENSFQWTRTDSYDVGAWTAGKEKEGGEVVSLMRKGMATRRSTYQGNGRLLEKE